MGSIYSRIRDWGNSMKRAKEERTGKIPVEDKKETIWIGLTLYKRTLRQELEMVEGQMLEDLNEANPPSCYLSNIPR